MPCVNRPTVLLCLEVPLWHSPHVSPARSLTDRESWSRVQPGTHNVPAARRDRLYLSPKDHTSGEGIQEQYIQGFCNQRPSDRCTAILSAIGTAAAAPTEEEIPDRSALLFFSATSNSMSG